LEGLECLTRVRRLFIIQDNDSLTSLVGLENLREINGDLGIYENVELCTSVVEAFVDQLLEAGGIGGDIIIYDNKEVSHYSIIKE
jgi:hypothetical protein